MLNEHTDVEAKQGLADKSTDHTEAYVAQLQLQSPPLALYHFQREFAGLIHLAVSFCYVSSLSASLIQVGLACSCWRQKMPKHQFSERYALYC